MNTDFDMVLRTVASFFILMVVSLWLGKQINSSNNHYNFALSITIGSYIANMGFDVRLHFLSMIFAFLALILIYFFISLISVRSRRLRNWLTGSPVVVIDNGKLMDANMKKLRYTLDDLNQQLREQGIFDIFEVKYAIFEVSGKLSVLKDPDYQPVTKKDLELKNPTVQNPVELVMDGKVIEKNHSTPSFNTLDQHLKIKNLEVKDVQYAVISTNGQLFIDLFDDHKESTGGKG